MATYFARKSGNINATDVWATTPSGTAAAVTFASGDVLLSNSFTVTVNVSTDLGATGEVRNDTTGGATAGGSFSLSTGVTLTANVFAGTAACVTLAGTASATIIGNLTGGTATNAHAVSVSSTGSLSITGSLTGGTAQTTHGVNLTASCTLTITGNLTGGSGLSAAALQVVTATNPITITGNLTGGVGGNSTNAIWHQSTATVTVTGNCTGGAGSVGAQNGSTGTLIINGTVTGAATAGATNVGAGTLTVTRAKGGPLTTSAAGVSGSTTGVTNVQEIEYGDLGVSPTSGPIRLTDASSNVAVMYRFGTTKKTLVDANASGLMPAASNVRSGTVYNGGNSTGTCAVPAAGSVALGVPVDATTGTAALTPAAVWDYATASATTSGSMGERLKNSATVASVGQSLSDALTPS
jgi:hypothetical protein